MANGNEDNGKGREARSWGRFLSFLTNPTTWSVSLVILLLIAVVLVIGSGSRPFIDQLPELQFARGVITLVFVLFTIGFAAIVLIHGLFMSDVAQEDRRFTRGREVLGLFIGIVGTIVGFYFGSVERATGVFDVAVVARYDAPDKDGKDVVINAHASGGTPPYRFTVTVGNKKVTEEPISSEDGWLSMRVKGDSADKLTVEATDAKDLKVSKTERIRNSQTKVENPTVAQPTPARESSP